MPIFGLLAGEWLHKALVLAAAPISLFVLMRTERGPTRRLFSFLISIGLAFLFLGAFVETFEAYETPLTVVGTLTLAATHLHHWRIHQA